MKEETKICRTCQHWKPNGGVLGMGYCIPNQWGYRKPSQTCDKWLAFPPYDPANNLPAGTELKLRDGRTVTLLDSDEEGNMYCQFGPGEDQRSWWGAYGNAELDDPAFVSDADIVGVISRPLF